MWNRGQHEATFCLWQTCRRIPISHKLHAANSPDGGMQSHPLRGSVAVTRAGSPARTRSVLLRKPSSIKLARGCIADADVPVEELRPESSALRIRESAPCSHKPVRICHRCCATLGLRIQEPERRSKMSEHCDYEPSIMTALDRGALSEELLATAPDASQALKQSSSGAICTNQ